MTINSISQAIPVSSSVISSNKQAAGYNNILLSSQVDRDSVSFGSNSPEKYVDAVRAIFNKKPEKLTQRFYNKALMHVLPNKKKEGSMYIEELFPDLLRKGEVVSRDKLKHVINPISEAIAKVSYLCKVPMDLKDKIADVVNRAAKGQNIDKAEIAALEKSISGLEAKIPEKLPRNAIKYGRY